MVTADDVRKFRSLHTSASNGAISNAGVEKIDLGHSSRSTTEPAKVILGHWSRMATLWRIGKCETYSRNEREIAVLKLEELISDMEALRVWWETKSK
jgi:hypothetical protein